MLRIINEKRDRYRPVFCTGDFYIQNQGLFEMWKKRFTKLSIVEKVQAWVFVLSCLRRPEDWFGGERKKGLRPISKNTNPTPLTLADLFLGTPILIPKKLDPQMSLEDVMNFCRVKALPESCLRSLCSLSEPKFPLIILNHVPSPRELLDYQLRGTRIVTFNEDFKTWPETILNERDFLSFIIHDLIHADHFFKDNKNTLGQLGFYHLIEMIWHQESLQARLLSSEFKTGFEYIISDMNSHPVHLLKTLHALLARTASSKIEADNCWSLWVDLWAKQVTMSLNDKPIENQNDRSALQKINTQLFSDTDAISLEKLCLEVGQKKALENTFNLL